MRIRRAMHARDLRTAPIDGVDVFLLTRVVDTMPLSELQEIAPFRSEEVARRIQKLAALGLVEVIPSAAQERMRPVLLASPEDLDESVTLRPPPRVAAVCEEALTLWPPMNAPLTLDLDDFGEPPQTGVRLKLPASSAAFDSLARSGKKR